MSTSLSKIKRTQAEATIFWRAISTSQVRKVGKSLLNSFSRGPTPDVGLQSTQRRGCAGQERFAAHAAPMTPLSHSATGVVASSSRREFRTRLKVNCLSEHDLIRSAITLPGTVRVLEEDFSTLNREGELSQRSVIPLTYFSRVSPAHGQVSAVMECQGVILIRASHSDQMVTRLHGLVEPLARRKQPPQKPLVVIETNQERRKHCNTNDEMAVVPDFVKGGYSRQA